MRRPSPDVARGAAGVLAVAGVTVVYVKWLHVSNAAIVSTTFLLIVLLVAATSRLSTAAVTSVAAMLTHRTVLKAIWGPNAVEQPEHLWTLVAQLRKKLEPDPANPQYLLSEPWVGYRFSVGESARSDSPSPPRD